MVTVVSTVPHKSVVKEVICRKCGSTLQYTPIEVKSHTYKDISGCSDTDYYIDCPVCAQKVYVSG